MKRKRDYVMSILVDAHRTLSIFLETGDTKAHALYGLRSMLEKCGDGNDEIDVHNQNILLCQVVEDAKKLITEFEELRGDLLDFKEEDMIPFSDEEKKD